jgi:aldose 1-epimerase
MPISSRPFGRTAAGQPVTLYLLTNNAGHEIHVSSYGATLVAAHVPDRAGGRADVLHGFDTLEGYLGEHPYFGSTVGRYGNRIARGRFELDGAAYHLAVNNGQNHLHGGPGGFHALCWEDSVDGERVTMRHLSPDGEEGYPGSLDASVTFSLDDTGALRLDYRAVTDRATVLNLTNHAYFNLAGGGDILGHELQIAAPRFLPVDATQIPTGEIVSVTSTPFDFTTSTAIGARINADDAQLKGALGGYDHCWVFDHGGDLGARVVKVREPGSGRTLEVYTTQPAVQFYSANFLDGSVRGKGGRPYEKHSAFCLETQHFPDSPNHPAFPSTVLRPGEEYRHTTIYRFGAE